jgi:hypothetical protein
VIAEVGQNNIVHIISDNGSNYKKACRHQIKFMSCFTDL